MNNNNKNIIKINSINENINNKLSNILKNIELTDEDNYRFTDNLIEFIENGNIRINSKLDLLPYDLWEEINKTIENKTYKDNVEDYINDINLYFDTFTMYDLKMCNIKHSKIYESSDSKQKRILNRIRKEKIWHASVLLKLIGGNTYKNYCCNSIKDEFIYTKKKEKEFIENTKLIDRNEKIINLKDVVRKTKEVIAEKINIIKTIEKIADDNNWTWIFITPTLKPELHPNPTKGKFSYNGTSPKESAKLMNENIKRVRSLMLKRGLKTGRDYIGVSASESHKDGCLHKHLLIFCDKKNIELIKDCFSYTFDNINDLEGSFKINNGKAKASSYIFKYVMKTLNNYDENLNFEEYEEENKNALLNNAFRSFNSIRGFAFFGIDNCLTKFRYIARNIDKMDLNLIVYNYIKNNDLYNLLKIGFFKEVKNEYVKKDNQNIFIGCIINNVEYLKRFFSLCKNDINDEIINMHSNMAILRESYLINNVDTYNYIKEVILNHNYTSNRQSLIKNLKNNYLIV